MDELPDALRPKGQNITIDAMGTQTAIAEKTLIELYARFHRARRTQTAIAEKIRKKKAEYVPAVKNNQKTLYEQLALYFEDAAFLNILKSN